MTDAARSARALFATLAAAAMIAGCTTGNDRITTGQPGEAFDPAEFGGKTSSSLEGSSKSVTKIGRADWPLMNVLVPVDGVAASPTYATTHTFTQTTARQRGEHPTALTALELGGNTTWQQYGEMSIAPFTATTDLVCMIPWMFAAGPAEESPVKPAMHWRAPVNIARVPYSDGTPLPERPESADTRTMPAKPKATPPRAATTAKPTTVSPSTDDPAAAYDAPRTPSPTSPAPQTPAPQSPSPK